MSKDFDYTAHPFGVKIIGPFVDPYKLTVLDYRVPYLLAYPAGPGQWNLVLDERFSIPCTDEDLRRWLPFLADAMAVAAGFSSHGEHSGPSNPFKTRLLGVQVERGEANHD